MKKIITVSSVLITSLLLGACGAESADDIIKSTAAAPSSGDSDSGTGGSDTGGRENTLPDITVRAPECTTTCDFVGLLSDTNKHTPPGASNPALHNSYVDSTFGTTIHRVTAKSQISGVSRIRHYYSKQNPFNADDSYAIFVTSDGYHWVYDAATFEPIVNASEYPHATYSEPEIQWHPTNPDQFYYIKDQNKYARFEISSKTTTILHDFAEEEGYTYVAGRLEGNMDKSGRYYAMIGESGGNSEAFVYDVESNQLSQRLNINDIEDEGIDWISISQNGQFVVLMARRSYVYDQNMNYKGRLPEGSYGHADLCVLADGREVMVYDGADHVVAGDGDRWINMAYLDTVEGDNATVEPLVKIGWSTTPHVSCRNTEFPGWALISNQGNGSNNYDKEIFWVKLDGSGEVRRVAHHYSDRETGGYFAEQHAATNKRGTKIIFASNYEGSDISSYLIDLTDFRRPLAD